jgi:AcrR family transcriptional regulator
VTHATLLRHFSSKEELILEVVDTVRRDFLTQLRADEGLQSAQSTQDLMRAAWRRLKEPREQRQFRLLFELIGDAARQPESVGRLSQTIIQDWLEPIERTLVQDGWDSSQASAMATLLLAQVRGLQLDLLVSGDRRRADMAFELALDLVRRQTS